MQLTVHERIVLRGILPQEGNIVTVRLVGELQQDLSFTEEDIKRYEISFAGQKYVDDNGVEQTVPQNSMHTGKDGDVPAEIAICDTMFKLIKEELAKMDKAQTLTAQHLAVYDKFFLENPPPEKVEEEVTETPAVAPEEGA